MAFNPDFEIAEAQALMAMSGWLEGAPPPPLTQMPFPTGWVSLYQSPQLGIFDNVWQLLHDSTSNPGRYAILIRGTVDESGSIVDDLLSVMIPASGTVLGHSYRFANDPLAGVHLGFRPGGPGRALGPHRRHPGQDAPALPPGERSVHRRSQPGRGDRHVDPVVPEQSTLRAESRPRLQDLCVRPAQARQLSLCVGIQRGIRQRRDGLLLE